MSKRQSGCIRCIWLLCLLKLCLFIKPTQFRQCHCQTFDMKLLFYSDLCLWYTESPDMLIIIIATGKTFFFNSCMLKCMSSLCIYIQIKDFPLNKKKIFCPKKSNWLVRVEFKHEIIMESPSCHKAYLFISSVEHKRRFFEEGFNCFCPYN